MAIAIAFPKLVRYTDFSFLLPFGHRTFGETSAWAFVERSVERTVRLRRWSQPNRRTAEPPRETSDVRRPTPSFKSGGGCLLQECLISTGNLNYEQLSHWRGYQNGHSWGWMDSGKENRI